MIIGSWKHLTVKCCLVCAQCATRLTFWYHWKLVKTHFMAFRVNYIRSDNISCQNCISRNIFLMFSDEKLWNMLKSEFFEGFDLYEENTKNVHFLTENAKNLRSLLVLDNISLIFHTRNPFLWPEIIILVWLKIGNFCMHIVANDQWWPFCHYSRIVALYV